MMIFITLNKAYFQSGETLMQNVIKSKTFSKENWFWDI